MLNFFQTIISYLETLWSFLSNMLSGLVNLFVVLLKALTLPQVLPGYLTPVLGSAVVIVSAIAVLKLVVGR